MRRIACALAPLTVVLMASASAQAWVPSATYDLPASGAGTCLRPAGVGTVSMFGAAGATTSTNLSLRVEPGAIVPGPTTVLGWQMGCAEPSSGAAPLLAGAVWNGHATVAAVAALGASAASFPAAPDDAEVGQVTVAQAASGAAVVAWVESRLAPGGPISFSSDNAPNERRRVVVAVRAPAARTFGGPIALSDWTEVPVSEPADLTAGIDDAGDVVVAWAQAEPTAATTRLATLPAGATAPGPTRRLAGGQPPALAVAANGRALLATGNGDVLERATPDAPFTQVPLLGVGGPADFAAALRPDGAAVVGRRGGAGVSVWLRPAGGSFGDEQPLVAQADTSRESLSTLGVGSVDDSAPQRPEIPVDALEVGDLHLILADDGRVAATWSQGDREGPAPIELLAAEGRVDGTMTAPSRVSSLCLNPIDAYPLLLADGQIGIVWTEVITGRPATTVSSRAAARRLHLSLPGQPSPAAPAPRLSARYSGPRALRASQPAKVEVRCTGMPCSVRVATSQDVGLPRGVSPFAWSVNAVSLAADTARRLPLTLFVSGDRPQRKPKAHPIEVVACDPAGAVVARRTLHPVVRQLMSRPAPRVVGLTARRSGSNVVVRWLTDRPARDVDFVAFFVSATARAYGHTAGKGRTRFRLVVHDVPRSARRITLNTISKEGADARTNHAVIT